MFHVTLVKRKKRSVLLHDKEVVMMASLHYIFAGVRCEQKLWEKTVIGRSAECDFILEAEEVSRRHCRITKRQGEFYVEDLNSSGGTLVNSRKVRKKVLHEGDCITVGPFTLRFSREDERVPSGKSTPSQTQDPESEPVTYLRVKKTIDHPESVALSSIIPPKKGESETRRFRDLWEIVVQLQHFSNPNELCSVMLGKMLACLPGDRAAVLWRDEQTGAVDVFCSRSRTNIGKQKRFRFPSGLQGMVIAEKKARLVEDAQRDRRLEGSRSTIEQGIRSAILAPLQDGQDCLGLIAVLSVTERECYDDDDLRFLCLVARLVSPALIGSMRYSELETENVALRMRLGQGRRHERLVGQSKCFQAVMEKAEQLAKSDAPLLLLGERGTGKTLLARKIHEFSPRKKGPFVSLSCPTVPESLMESELFGHERGAFTGALDMKKGKMETAQGGSVLLDEIADLSMRMQAKLLQFIETRTFQRVGATISRKADVRIIASTNKDLRKEVEAGRFRADLFDRLYVVNLDLPPLRGRKDDIPPLVLHFITMYGEIENKQALRISPKSMEALMSYDWPGNVRELENVIRRAVILCRDATIQPGDFFVEKVRTSQFDCPELDFHDAVIAFKRWLIERTMNDCGCSQRKAAEKLGLNETYLAKLIKKYGVRR